MLNTPQGDVRTRVILADDNAIMRDKVALLLEPEFEVVGSVADGTALLDAVALLDPEIGVVDISMPGMGGIEAVRELMDHGSALKVVFLTVHEDPDFARAAFDSGALAYVVKSRLVSDLLPALRGVLDGQVFISPFALIDTCPLSEPETEH